MHGEIGFKTRHLSKIFQKYLINSNLNAKNNNN